MIATFVRSHCTMALFTDRVQQLNVFIYIGMLNWMVASFDNGTLCEWNNAQHFVCTDAVLVFASAIEFGAFGTKNFFDLYPILPWTFLMGLAGGVTFAIGQLYGPQIRHWCSRRLRPRFYAACQRFLFVPLSYLSNFKPSRLYTGITQLGRRQQSVVCHERTLHIHRVHVLHQEEVRRMVAEIQLHPRSWI